MTTRKRTEPKGRTKINATGAKNGDGARAEVRQSPAAEKPASKKKTRVVAIGASAGGLEPIEQFFDAVPLDSGLAYVVVQHLSPDFRSMMPELLQRHSNLEIVKIENEMEIRPDVIYLSPARSSLEIGNGRFKLADRKDAYEFSLPINDFLNSLAAEAGSEAICVILSGTGTDGTLGCEAIAAVDGVVLAQDPTTAKFESMPRSVIDAVPGTVYAPPSRLAEIVLRAAAGEEVAMPPVEVSAEFATPTREIVRLLQRRYGLDFGYYKTSTVGRRIARRAKLAGTDDIADYAARLARNTEELEELYIDLLIGVTAFFRDRPAFDLLAAKVVPELGTRMAKGREVRIWVPGCASGEEAYSLAILCAERARIIKSPLKIKVFATDIHPRSLKAAGRGVYSAASLAAVPEEIKDRYFSLSGDHYQLNKDIREHVVFSKHNLIKDPPFTRMDLVSCRNLLIYLDDEAQRKAIAMFHFALRQGGTLFLGPSETLGSLSDEFDTIDHRWRIFKKRRDVRLVEATRLLPLTSGFTSSARASENAMRDSDQIMHFASASGLQRHSLMRVYDAVLAKTVGTSILVSRTGEVLHVFGDAGKFLGFGKGQFSNKVADLIDDQLRLTVSAGIDRVVKSVDDDFSRSVNYVDPATGDQRTVSVGVSIVETSGSVDDSPLLITLTETSDILPSARMATDDEGDQVWDQDVLQKRILELERDLRFSEETLQTTIEELETSNEELQATNEELQATNEELMAANEELQTVNEELHAVNEELYTVSSEHHSKISDLTSLTSDLDNLLLSTNIGVLFLDSDLSIRRATPALAQTFNIMARDVGRPVSHVTSRFEFPDLEAAVRSVATGGGVIERNIEVEGRDYLLRVLPYRRDDVVDGAVLTFVDITDIARANRSLAQFADIVSHDLKAPLRAIKTTTDWIIEDLRDSADAEIRAHAERLVEQTNRLSQMLTDLRDFSNLKPGSERVEEVSVAEVLEEIGSFFSAEHLKLEFEDMPQIETSKAPLYLVFRNLVDNAVKHNDKQPTTIKVSATPRHGAWLFAVADDGPGINPRHHDKIFLPFRKLKPMSQSSGSGIGLALVKKTIEDNGGSIEITSDPEKARGTTVSFTWPSDGGVEGAES